MEQPRHPQPRSTPRWWALPLAVLTVGLAVVTWGAVGAMAAEPSFLGLLRLVIEGIATGFLAWTTWRVGAGRTGADVR